jgi:hypothetical protein
LHLTRPRGPWEKVVLAGEPRSFDQRRMTPMELPMGLDYAWLGCDAEGHVARFTNAGNGPIPAFLLANRHLADGVEALTRALPVVSDSEILMSLPNPTDFMEIARRGIYGFDWQDATRISGRSGSYEIVSRPRSPLRLAQLPPALLRLVELVRFDGFRFSDSHTIDVASFLETVE